MNPNRTLEELLAWANDVINSDDKDDDSNEAYERLGIAEYILALDGWMTGGGFLPKRWERGA